MAGKKKATTRAPRRPRKPAPNAGPPGLADEVGADRARRVAAGGAAKEPPTVTIAGESHALTKSFFKELLKSTYGAVGQLSEPHPDPRSLTSTAIWEMSDEEADGYGVCLEEIARQEGEAFARNAPWVILGAGLLVSTLARCWMTYQMVRAKKGKAPDAETTAPAAAK